MKKEFISKDFKVPRKLKTCDFEIRPIKSKDAKKDYKAVMESVDRLKGIFGPKNKWPPKDLTFREEILSLKIHKRDFEKRKSFTYAVFDKKKKYVGCVYIFPSHKIKFDAIVFMWVRSSKLKLDKKLYKLVKSWIKEKWPFEKVAYPGRSLSFEEFEKS